jgi:hypothetical protein
VLVSAGNRDNQTAAWSQFERSERKECFPVLGTLPLPCRANLAGAALKSEMSWNPWGKDALLVYIVTEAIGLPAMWPSRWQWRQ